VQQAIATHDMLALWDEANVVYHFLSIPRFGRSGDGRVNIWDPELQELLVTLDAHTEPVSGIGLYHAGTLRIATAATDGLMKLVRHDTSLMRRRRAGAYFS
jgi:WD40 repeat protein